MLISEVAGAAAQAPRLFALAEFFAGRLRDQAVEPRMSRAAFLKLSGRLGIPIRSDQLKDMSKQPPLNSIIQDVTGSDDKDDGEVIFRGADTGPGTDQADDEMTPDQAQDTVDAMSKRAALKGV